MILANFGTFDVKNYGDSLFPLIVEQQLGHLFSGFIHVSPVGGQAYRDVPRSISYKQFEKESPKVDAVVIGGGNILHGRRTPLPDYSEVQRTAYPSLWVGAAKVAASQNVPLIVNSPGIPKQPGRLIAPIMRMVFRQASYSSVRDDRSKANLGLCNGVPVRVVPDSALLLNESLGELKNGSGSNEVTVHLNQRYVNGNPVEIAGILDTLSTILNLKVHLLGIGVCHGDDLLAQAVSEGMETEHRITANPDTVNEVASAIANSQLYIGSSLHGFITASSYAVPALIVADGAQQHKFAGLLQQLGASDRMINSWAEVLDAAREAKLSDTLEHSNFGKNVELTTVRNVLHSHWQGISAALSSNDHQRSMPLKFVPKPQNLVAGSNIFEQLPSFLQTRILGKLTNS